MARDTLRPANGDLEIAANLMAIRYAQSYGYWVQALYAPSPDRAALALLERRYKRQSEALFRLTAALARRQS